jgi:hypothetical protein
MFEVTNPDSWGHSSSVQKDEAVSEASSLLQQKRQPPPQQNNFFWDIANPGIGNNLPDISRN